MEADAGIALAAVAPFAVAALAPVLTRLVRPFAAWLLAFIPAAIFLFLFSHIERIAAGDVVIARLSWAPVHGLELSFLLDGLSLIFALAISGIGTLIVLYSGAYLKAEAHLGRFLGFLLAFMGAMLGLVLADSLLALFMFWELTSVTSFLLIGYDHTRQAARRGAIQALILTNIGGLALLFGAVLVHHLTGQWEMSALGGEIRTHGLYGVVLAAFLVAAFTKSAQVPLHFWLPNAMEAPTPVSAFLHSATMVQGGVYLLARATPFLGGTPVWTALLVGFGGATLIWGVLGALRQTDLKQMLAQTTIASLGLSVLLIGLGTEAAIAAMVLYFLAHALYKAALFMVTGAIDHEAGTRDLTLLGGLADRMPVSFIGAALACLSMFGLPMTLGYFAKEEMYLGLLAWNWHELAVMVVLLAGNGALAGIAMIVLVRPFLGPVLPTPKTGNEAPLAMLIGPIALGAAGIVMAVMPGWLGAALLAPGVSAILGAPAASHLSLAIDVTSPLLWLSIATWGLGILAFQQSTRLRVVLRRFEAPGWSADRAFDVVMFGLIRFGAAATRLLHHGRLELYLLLVFVALALALFVPMAGQGGYAALLPLAELGDWRAFLRWPELMAYEWAVILLAVVGLVALLMARSRLVAILALGIQGAAVALLFLLFGAPDLAFTQFMVEVLSVVILALVMTRLRLDERDPRPFEDLARDGTLALACGAGVSLLLMVVLSGPLNTTLSDAFAATSVPLAHGHNIVNVILVDYRGFDTLGEISVVMAAGIAIMALLRRRGDKQRGKA